MTRKPVPSQISKHLGGEKGDKEEQFHSSNSKHLRKAICKYIEEVEEARMTDMLSRKHYTAGSWPEMQADSIGYLRALREIKAIIGE